MNDLAPLLKLPKTEGDLGKFIVTKVQKIANSGHTGPGSSSVNPFFKEKLRKTLLEEGKGTMW